jgi:hypothetical protein
MCFVSSVIASLSWVFAYTLHSLIVIFQKGPDEDFNRKDLLVTVLPKIFEL